MLEGLLVAYLNLDRVIEIIRTEDEPKAVMIAEFRLTDVQAEAILNMRLRNLRQLEEMEIRAERDALTAERAGLARCSPTRTAQWSAHRRRAARGAQGLRQGRARRRAAHHASTTRRRSRRSSFEAMIEREPVTVVCSEMGWIRAMKGHLDARRRAQVQGRRRAALLPAGRDHRPAAALRLERADVHAGLRRRCPAAAAWASRCG